MIGSITVHNICDMTAVSYCGVAWLKIQHGSFGKKSSDEAVVFFMPLELAEILAEAYHDYYAGKPAALNIYEGAALDRADHLRELSKEGTE